MCSEVLARGRQCALRATTVQQASRVRGKHPQPDVDTCSGAVFLYRDAMEVMDSLTRYDLVAVDEVSQLSQTDFERIIQMWETADKMPALVFAGDFWQLPGFSRKGPEPSKATGSPRWNMLYKVELHEMWRCKDTVMKKKLEALRTAEPSRQQPRDIFAGGTKPGQAMQGRRPGTSSSCTGTTPTRLLPPALAERRPW